jgi:hypothetical protein
MSIEIPSNFRSVITDFTNDLTLTFPEYAAQWAQWTASAGMPDEEIRNLFDYSLTVYPERFFDILYQNEDIFNVEGTVNVNFLPGIDFKTLFRCEGVSENTKKTMWKYLQLILFSVIGGVKDKSTFGDSMNIFNGIDEAELQGKLKETMENLTQFFTNTMDDMETNAANTEGASSEGAASQEGSSGETPFEKFFSGIPRQGEGGSKMEGMPDVDNLQDHLRGLFNGKIGSLARELAEEISGDFTDIMDSEPTSTGDVLKSLMKNPKKIMDLMKKVGSKLDKKMSDGNISKEELMKEASEMLSKMKDMGGTEQFNEMFKNLAKNMGGMGKNAKLDTNALTRMTKQNATRERLLKKLEEKKRAQAGSTQQNYMLQSTEQPGNYVFKLPDAGVQEKSYVHPDLIAEMEKSDAAKSREGGSKEGGSRESGGAKKKKKKSKK